LTYIQIVVTNNCIFLGRDTPSSQITEGDEVGQAGASTRQQLDFNPPPPQNKHSRFDIDDKFGKFEIKTLIEGLK
jgi:hypothetical protein